jgi:hypothetical protein
LIPRPEWLGGYARIGAFASRGAGLTISCGGFDAVATGRVISAPSNYKLTERAEIVIDAT